MVNGQIVNFIVSMGVEIKHLTGARAGDRFTDQHYLIEEQVATIPGVSLAPSKMSQNVRIVRLSV